MNSYALKSKIARVGPSLKGPFYLGGIMKIFIRIIDSFLITMAILAVILGCAVAFVLMAKALSNYGISPAYISSIIILYIFVFLALGD